MQQPGSVARWKHILDVVSTIAVLLAAVAVVVWVGGQWLNQPKGRALPIPAAPVSLQGAVLKGDPNAPLAVIVYSDFECPFCGTFARDSMPKLLEQFVDTGKARIGFVQHPLEGLHKQALHAAEAAVCAGRQNRFWEMHDSLFADQQHLDGPSLVARADSIGIDRPAFAACMAGEALSEVRTGIKSAETLGLSGTPAFLVGRVQPGGDLKVSKVISGAGSLVELTQALKADGDVVVPGLSRQWFGAAAIVGVGALMWRWNARRRIAMRPLGS